MESYRKFEDKKICPKSFRPKWISNRWIIQHLSEEVLSDPFNASPTNLRLVVDDADVGQVVVAAHVEGVDEVEHLSANVR
jgi:hypothetical protein